MGSVIYPTVQKRHYTWRDFIDHREQIYLGISRDKDALLEHDHDFYELVLVLSGIGTHHINGKVHQVAPGDVFLIQPSDIHYFVPIEEFSWLNCVWVPEFLTINDSLLIHTKKFDECYSYDIPNIMMDLLKEYRMKSANYLPIIKHQLIALMLKLSRIVLTAESSYGDRHKKQIVKKVLTYIHEHFSEPVNLQEIADEVIISQVYLCKLFKDSMGISVMQYLRKVRVDKAIQLLLNTDMKNEDIAKSVGFSDVKSFYSAFKTQVGIPPGKFKRHGI